MEMPTGKTIQTLRRQKGLTQEQLNARIRLLEQNGISACIVASPALS